MIPEGRIVLTRVKTIHYTEYEVQDPNSPVGLFTPLGADVARPFPEARIWQIEHRDGWFYVYWVSAHLAHPADT